MGERRGTKALELWCRRMVEGYKNVRVDNMTTSWRDGLAFCALVCKCSSLKQLPDLIHFDQLKKEDVFHNNELAFRVAEEYLNIPALLDPQDMVAYEIPDKLSILTYLSQFYQVFGAQENSLRLSKRSSTEANKSSTSTPPAKMAHVVPKREPCIKCNNPIFFAERLVIENQLYHRTCFKCARCNSVLTLGNFYQTEKDHEFCCETCPDEERQQKSKVDETNRLSIAQRIALFETSTVLKKSMSDEEKSKSLSRQLPANSQAFNSFLSSQINGKAQVESEDEKTIDTNSLSSDSDSDDEASSMPQEKKLAPSKSDSRTINTNSNINNIETTKEQSLHETAQAKKEAVAVSVKAESPQYTLVTDDYLQDDIELEFERLAEEAINSTISLEPKMLPEKSAVPKVSAIPSKQSESLAPIQSIPEPLPQEKNASLPEKVAPEAVLEEISHTESESKPEAELVVENITIEKNAEVVAVEKIDSQVNEDDKSEEIKASIPVEKSDKEANLDYPEDKNPFGDDEDEEDESVSQPTKNKSLNPFGSCSEDEQENAPARISKPPRPPPPRAKITKGTNPFGSEDEEEEETATQNRTPIRTPVPTPRKQLHSITPEPTPRHNLSSQHSPGQSFTGSTSSLASSSDGTNALRRRKKKAPAPPPPTTTTSNLNTEEKTKTLVTPKKKRPAPTPPTSTPIKSSNEQSVDTSVLSENNESFVSEVNESSLTNVTSEVEQTNESIISERRLIPLEESLISEGSSGTANQNDSQEVTYRRKIVPLSQSSADDSFENLEQTKDHKEAENRHRQSQSSIKADSVDSLPYINKSSHGKWKRRKGPAPALPGFALPQRRVLQMLPLQEIRHELEVIEVQQQGLEKQGVMLEKMIRERCEGVGDNRTTEELLESLPNAKNPKEVEELILQLFELVNEKNELFRRQAELMYLRRAHRLEEEQADVEYEIRKLMAQPEHNKTDSDKAKEEALIARLVEIVQLRNEVVDCLEMDRQREVEEDMSIKQRMESHTAKLDQEYLNQTPTKLSKKEKKKLKEAKKLKNKKLNDADKDLDTSEIKAEASEKKKKKKKFLF